MSKNSSSSFILGALIGGAAAAAAALLLAPKAGEELRQDLANRAEDLKDKATGYGNFPPEPMTDYSEYVYDEAAEPDYTFREQKVDISEKFQANPATPASEAEVEEDIVIAMDDVAQEAIEEEKEVSEKEEEATEETESESDSE